MKNVAFEITEDLLSEMDQIQIFGGVAEGGETNSLCVFNSDCPTNDGCVANTTCPRNDNCTTNNNCPVNNTSCPTKSKMCYIERKSKCVVV